jgi:hypothetical protein
VVVRLREARGSTVDHRGSVAYASSRWTPETRV